MIDLNKDKSNKAHPIREWLDDKLPDTRGERFALIGGTVLFLGIVGYFWHDARNGDNEPPRHRSEVVKCADAQPGKHGPIELGKDTVRLAVVAEGYSPLEVGTFAVEGKKVTVRQGDGSPEVLTNIQPRTIKFTYDNEPIAEVTAALAKDNHINVTCTPEGEN